MLWAAGKTSALSGALYIKRSNRSAFALPDRADARGLVVGAKIAADSAAIDGVFECQGRFCRLISEPLQPSPCAAQEAGVVQAPACFANTHLKRTAHKNMRQSPPGRHLCRYKGRRYPSCPLCLFPQKAARAAFYAVTLVICDKPFA